MQCHSVWIRLLLKETMKLQGWGRKSWTEHRRIRTVPPLGRTSEEVRGAPTSMEETQCLVFSFRHENLCFALSPFLSCLLLCIYIEYSGITLDTVVLRFYWDTTLNQIDIESGSQHRNNWWIVKILMEYSIARHSDTVACIRRPKRRTHKKHCHCHLQSYEDQLAIKA